MVPRKLIFFHSLFVGICLGVSFSLPLTAESDASLARRIVDSLKAKEPNWTYHSFVESLHEPLVTSEKRIVTGWWYGPDFPKSKSQDVEVHVYSAESVPEARAWLKPWRDKQVAEGWEVNRFEIGDEGYLGKYKTGERFEVSFRKGNVVAKAAARDLDKLKEFAQCIAESITADQGASIQRVVKSRHYPLVNAVTTKFLLASGPLGMFPISGLPGSLRLKVS